MSAINLFSEHLCAACLLHAWHPVYDDIKTSRCFMVLLSAECLIIKINVENDTKR